MLRQSDCSLQIQWNVAITMINSLQFKYISNTTVKLVNLIVVKNSYSNNRTPSVSETQSASLLF